MTMTKYTYVAIQQNAKQQCNACDAQIVALLDQIDALRQLEKIVRQYNVDNDIDDDACFIDARVDDAYHDLKIYRDEFINAK